MPSPDERYAAEYLAAHRALTAAGFDHYEVSNAGRAGHRARHNSAYWRRAPFIGLGPSAHSGFGARRSWNVREWAHYQRLIDAHATVRVEEEVLDQEQLRLEELYLGLRTTDGLASDQLPTTAGAAWAASGWAETLDGRVCLTPEGWLRLDALVRSIA